MIKIYKYVFGGQGEKAVVEPGGTPEPNPDQGEEKFL